MSPVIGAPSVVTVVGGTVYAATTNQGELIRLRGSWTSADPLSISSAIGSGSQPIWYASIVPFHGQLLVSLASGM